MAKKLSEQEKLQLDLGKKLQEFYNMGYVNKKQALSYSFLKGMLSGFGAVIGGTILIAFLIWILAQFGQVPLIGHFVESIRHTLSTHNSGN